MTLREFLDVLAPPGSPTLVNGRTPTPPAVAVRHHQVRLLTSGRTRRPPGHSHTLWTMLCDPPRDGGGRPGRSTVERHLDVHDVAWERTSAEAVAARFADMVATFTTMREAETDPDAPRWSGPDDRRGETGAAWIVPTAFASPRAREAAWAACGAPRLARAPSQPDLRIRDGEAGFERMAALVGDLADVTTLETVDGLAYGWQDAPRAGFTLGVVSEDATMIARTRSPRPGRVNHALQFVAAHFRPLARRPWRFEAHSRALGASACLEAVAAARSAQARARLRAFLEEAGAPGYLARAFATRRDPSWPKRRA